MKTLLAALVMTFSFTSFSQIGNKSCPPEAAKSTHQVEDHKDNSAELTIDDFDGSFQISTIQGDKFYLNDAFFTWVEEQRKESEDVSLDLGNGRSITILSRNKLTQANGDRFSSFISYK